MTVAAQEQGAPGIGLGRLSPQLASWLVFAVFALACILLRDELKWLVNYPKEWFLKLPIDGEWVLLEKALESLMDWITATFKPVFRFISMVLTYPMRWLEGLLHWLPWPATFAIVTILAYRAKDLRLALFCLAGLAYMLIVGYWDESMSTLALVGMSVPLSLAIGLIMGLLAFQYRWARRIVEPTLDVMQTVPTFAYLVPILILFGVGPVVGMVASAIYASPPMVRNVMLGLRRVSDDVIESGQMSGCNRFQLLFQVRIPAATPTIMVGVNQTIMAALSMVIIAAIIGGFADIGWEVLSTMRKAQTGQSLLAGIVIVVMAMMMDRISRGFTERTGDIPIHTGGNLLHRHPYLLAALAATVVGVVLSHLIPFFKDYPESLVFYPAEPLNDAVSWFTREFFFLTDAIKTWTLYYFMLPMKAGLERIARPDSWGFEMTQTAAAIYWALVLALGAGPVRLFGWRAGVVVGLLGVLYFYGSTGTPWPAFIVAVTLIAYQVGG